MCASCLIMSPIQCSVFLLTLYLLFETMDNINIMITNNIKNVKQSNHKTETLKYLQILKPFTKKSHANNGDRK